MKHIHPALIFLAAVAFAASPLVVTGFNGFTPMQFPVPQVDPPVQPAGYTFSIWGLIYTWLIAGAAFGWMRRPQGADWVAMRPALFSSLLLGAFWIPLAQVSVIWATVLIWIMLATALVALLWAGFDDRWWLQAPIAIYAGWLTAASSVSIGLLLAGFGVTGEVLAAFAGIGLALVIGLWIQTKRPMAPEYGLTLIWALVGVIVANSTPAFWPVLALCGAGIALIAARLLRPAI